MDNYEIKSIESDPNGLSPHTPGAKLDSGKLMVALCIEDFAKALLAVAEVTTYGARKYTPRGWKSVKDGKARYMDALCRHLLLHMSGEENDTESGLKHLSHACWNMLAVLELTQGKKNGNTNK